MKTHKSIFFSALFLLLCVAVLQAQEGVKIAPTPSAPHGSAMLEVESSSKGVLISRMTTPQREAIQNPATGLLVYDQTEKAFYYHDGSGWQPILGGSGAGLWETDGTNVWRNDGHVGLGNNPQRFSIEMQEYHYTDPDFEAGVITLRSTKDNRQIIIGSDGNEIKTPNSQLSLNWATGTNVEIGGGGADFESHLLLHKGNLYVANGNIEAPNGGITVGGGMNVSGVMDVGGDITTGGEICAAGSVKANRLICDSDQHLKENIIPLENALSLIKKLNPVSFHWKFEPEEPKQFGFIAQEVENVATFSSFVEEIEDPFPREGKPASYKTLNYIGFIPFLIKGMQEQQQQISTLEEKLQTQQSLLEQQQNQMELLLKRVELLEKGTKVTNSPANKTEK